MDSPPTKLFRRLPFQKVSGLTHLIIFFTQVKIVVMKYFIANWKANKNLQEAEDWINQFLKLYQPNEDKMVIICPPSPFLISLKQKINRTKNLKLGSQNISSFETGAYTGEITAQSLVGLADYVIIGHHERRKYFEETNEVIRKKIYLAKKYQLEPILCLSEKKDWLANDQINLVAYEPVSAIGSGKNESVERVIQLKNQLHLQPTTVYLYGGSVNENNAFSYLKNDQINGLLIGGSSLNPVSFYKIIAQI